MTLTESAVGLLADKGYDSKMGARPLGRKIDELIRVPLSKKILFDNLKDCSITVDVRDDQLVFLTEANDNSGLPTVDNNGYIVVE